MYYEMMHIEMKHKGCLPAVCGSRRQTGVTFSANLLVAIVPLRRVR